MALFNTNRSLNNYGLEVLTWDMKKEYTEYLYQMEFSFWDYSFEIMLNLMMTTSNIKIYKRLINGYYCTFCINTLTKAVTLYGIPRGKYDSKKIMTVYKESLPVLKQIYDDMKLKHIYFELIPKKHLSDLKTFLKTQNLKLSCYSTEPDFVFDTQKLIELKGNDYKTRRANVNRFKRENPNYQIIPYEPFMKNECCELYKTWCKNLISLHSDYGIFEENAYINILNNYDRLELTQYVLIVDGNIIATLIIDKLCENMCSVLFEYTDVNYMGSSEILWYESLRLFKEQKYDCEYENDADAKIDTGLYKYKMSHRPAFLENKNGISIRFGV